MFSSFGSILTSMKTAVNGKTSSAISVLMSIQRCLNTNTLRIVIHQSGYPTEDVSAINSITDVVPACRCFTRSTPLFEKLRWFGLAYPSRYIRPNHLSFSKRGIEGVEYRDGYARPNTSIHYCTMEY